MTRFRETFKNKHVVLPVVHVSDEGQALRNVAVAREAGADGVFLINHAISSEALLAIYCRVAAEHKWWIGLNCLDLSPFSLSNVGLCTIVVGGPNLCSKGATTEM